MYRRLRGEQLNDIEGWWQRRYDKRKKAAEKELRMATYVFRNHEGEEMRCTGKELYDSGIRNLETQITMDIPRDHEINKSRYFLHSIERQTEDCS